MKRKSLVSIGVSIVAFGGLGAASASAGSVSADAIAMGAPATGCRHIRPCRVQPARSRRQQIQHLFSSEAGRLGRQEFWLRRSRTSTLPVACPFAAKSARIDYRHRCRRQTSLFAGGRRSWPSQTSRTCSNAICRIVDGRRTGDRPIPVYDSEGGRFGRDHNPQLESSWRCVRSLHPLRAEHIFKLPVRGGGEPPADEHG